MENLLLICLEYHLNEQRKVKDTPSPLDELTHPHNEILLWVVEGGVAPLIAICIIAFAYLNLFRSYKLKDILPLLSLIFPIFIHTQTELPFYISITHGVYFIIILWYTDQVLGTHKSLSLYKMRYINTIKVIVITIPVLIIPFMLTTIHTAIKMELFKESQYEKKLHFDAIVNTLSWSNYIDMTIATQGLLNGYKNKDPQALIRYLNWGEMFVQHTPRKRFYRNMILAIQTLEKNNIEIDINRKQKIHSDAIRLYPRFVK